MGELLLILVWSVVVVGMFVLWIWTLIDCIKNEPTEGNERIVWVVVIAAANWIGALIYLIMRRPKRKAMLGR
jgi:O-antigen/teichoic acid export membrane protein